MSESFRTLRERMSEIDLLVLDVDGVLTEGRIIYTAGEQEQGHESKEFHVRDGSGLKLWHLAGKQSAIVTGRSSSVVKRRAEELGIQWIRQGVTDKRTGLEAVLGESSISPHKVCYIGDDLPDLSALQMVGLAVAVADGGVEVRAVAHYVTSQPGGRGAVREVIERILRCQGKWR